MKRLLLFLFLSLSLFSIKAQNVTISGNKFMVGDKQIWFNGINTPWHLFNDFGRSDFNPTWWQEEFQRYVDSKINLARVWIHGSGEVSPTITSDGTVTGATDLFYQHMDVLMNTANSKKVYVMPCLFSFDIAKNTYTTYTQWRAFISSQTKIQSYIDNVLIPLVKRYDAEPYLLGWEICNEPEWMFENAEEGPMLKSDVQRLHAMCAAAIHKNSTKPVTTGSSCVKWNSPLYEGTGDNAGNVWSATALQSVYNDSKAFLDFWQIHWYTWMSEWFSSPYQRTTVFYQIDDKPVIVGESEGNDVCDNFICQTLVQMYENTYLNGFDGMCAWKTPQNDGHGTLANIAVATNAFYSNHAALVYPLTTVIVPVTGVSVSPTTATVNIASTTTLKATVGPTNATNKTITWTSGNTAIATVSVSGVVTGVTEGSAVITATTQDGSFKATSTITVTKTAPTCENAVPATLPLVLNGAGDYCYSTSGTITNTNSWGTDLVNINGTSLTNVYSATMPERINGLYYIHYKGSVAWSHLDVNGSGGTNVSVTGVSVTPTTATINPGATANLTATVVPTNATNKSVTWSSSNTAIATVSTAGVVTGIAAGSATVTVTTADGAKTATAAITVNSTTVSVTGVLVSPTTATLNPGATATLTATVAPTNATNKSVTWSSSNTSIATVSTAGVVTGVAAGSATITVTTVDGSKTATAAITVNSTTVSVTGVSVSPTTATINPGATSTLTATVAPTNATNKSVTWSSSNTSIATVSAAGVVTGVAAGSATITVTTVDGAKTATAAITVNTTTVSVTGVTVSPASATINTGVSTTLTATIAPTNATNKSVTWSTSSSSIATVSSSGVVTGVSAGIAIITVTTVDGAKTATASITVTTTGTPCSNPVTISIPYTYNGVGEFCWSTSQAIAYINSWNMDLVEINGVNYTNKWSNSLPAAINGLWYIHYKGSYAWSHFEAPALKNATSIEFSQRNDVEVYPNPFSDIININLGLLKNVQKIELYNSIGQLIKQIDENQISSSIIQLDINYPGNIFILQIHADNEIIVKHLLKQ